MLSTALCTSTLTLQVPTAKFGLSKVMVLVPAVAVTLPPQGFTTLGGLATTRLPGTVPTFWGKLSVKPASIVTTLPLVMAKVMVLVLVPVPAVVWIVLGLKVLVKEGGCNTTSPMLALPPL